MKLKTSQSGSSHQKQNKNQLNFVDQSQRIHSAKLQIDNQQLYQPKMLTQTIFNTACFNHKRKQATYYFHQAGNLLNVCQKCAIMIASKGFPVQKINKLQEQNLQSVEKRSKQVFEKESRKAAQIKKIQNVRMAKMSALNQLVRRERKQFQDKYKQVETLLMKSSSQYSALICDINQYFEVVEKMVEYQKYLAYNKVLSKRMENEKDARLLKARILKTIEELDKMGLDIEENGDVAQTISKQQFESIIENYELAIVRFENFKSLNSQVEVFNKIEFPIIANTINSISNAIVLRDQENIKSIFTVQIKQNTRKNSLVEGLSKKMLKTTSIQSESDHDQNQGPNKKAYLKVNSNRISECSFSAKNEIMRSNIQMCHNLIETPSKQSSLANPSFAFSITQYDGQSNRDNNNLTNTKIHEQIDFAKQNKRGNTNKLLKTDESVDQYFLSEETQQFSQTDSQKSETLLLKQQ